MDNSISIHAPTRGATMPMRWRLCNRIYFNPRSHERSDTGFSMSAHTLKYFNPRSHERSDLYFLRCICVVFIFQSTLPREERLFPCLPIFRPHDIFQSTLPREERRRLATASADILYHFNPRSHERSDRSLSEASSRISYFNPRSHERSD